MVFTPTINNENNTNPKIDSKTLNNKAKEIPKPRNSLVHLHTNKAKKIHSFQKEIILNIYKFKDNVRVIEKDIFSHF